MEDLKQGLERVLQEPIRTEGDARRVSEAATILADLLRIEERADRLLNTTASKPGEGSLAGMTLHEAARRVLEEAGIPLHARELGARIKARGWRHPRSERARPDQIVFQLAARLPRHPGVFRRVAPNTFALVDWGDEPFARTPRRPRVGLFAAAGISGRDIDDSEEPFEANPWRSS
ncbi:MAG TPA: winged helix-turn-helix domain-containing protein [Actinomycetota bacterium]|jgi:hypothetical protein|nr:winged helix-turn-helix domain-containing protein [Actinomycetota bacterium]